MVPPPAAALALPLVETDPVWAAALAAPPCTEPIPAEELDGLDDDVADMRAGRVRGHGSEDIRATIEQMRRDAGE